MIKRLKGILTRIMHLGINIVPVNIYLKTNNFTLLEH